MDIEKLYGVISTIFNRDNERTDVQDLEIQLEPLCGLSNQIYLVKIYDKKSKVLLKEMVYKVFGENNDIMDRKLEEEIMENLSSRGFGPKVLVSDHKTFRAEEYVKGAQELQVSELMEEQIVNQIIRILVSYSLFASVHTYHLFSDQFSTDYNVVISEGKNLTGKIQKNIYDMCTKNMFQKATKNFQKFSNKFKERFDKIMDKEIYSNFKKLKIYLKNYKEMFKKVFPKEAFLVLNHNDVHRLNILAFDKSKLMLIDHEYAALNLIGIDMVNYMIEANFNYKVKEHPFFEFSETLDYEKMFETYLQYLEEYEQHLISSKKLENEQERVLFSKCKTKEYFFKLVCVISLFWFIYSIIYLDFSTFELQNFFDYFLHGIKRLEIFENAYSMVESQIFI